jgi:hypothetical protein
MTSLAVRVEEWPAADLTAKRVMALSPLGDCVAVREPGGLRLIDAGGQRPAVDLAFPEALDFVWSGERPWVAGRKAIAAYAVDGAALATRDLTGWPGPLQPVPGGGVLLTGDAAMLARVEGGAIEMEPVGEGEAEEAVLASLGGLRTLRARGREIRVTDPGRELHRLRLRGPGQVAAATRILDGAAIAVVSQSDGGLAIDVVRLPGGLVHHIEIEGGREIVFAARRGLAVAVTDADELVAVKKTCATGTSRRGRRRRWPGAMSMSMRPPPGQAAPPPGVSSRLAWAARRPPRRRCCRGREPNPHPTV